MAIAKLEETPRTSGADKMTSDLSWEAPLSDDDRDKLLADLKQRYSVRLEAHVRPGDPLVRHIYRAFHKW